VHALGNTGRARTRATLAPAASYRVPLALCSCARALLYSTGFGLNATLGSSG
jgi:hypothetical protein